MFILVRRGEEKEVVRDVTNVMFHCRKGKESSKSFSQIITRTWGRVIEVLMGGNLRFTTLVVVFGGEK